MPEYLALIHYRNSEDGETSPPPSADDVTAAFIRMERAGIARVN